MPRFMPTLLKIEGSNVTQFPLLHHRHAGRSHYGIWNRLFASFYDLLAVRGRRSGCSATRSRKKSIDRKNLKTGRAYLDA